jgi:methyltransferase (TIGR00027 family)
MISSTIKIQDVTDTAIWVAVYRAEEALRKDALFHDKLAAILIGEYGVQLAKRTQGSRYTAWSVVIRTYIIDQFINSLVKENIDTVINLGAGLDTRPYRLELPSNLRWVEVDFPKLIDLKNERLKNESPTCKLERLGLDLSNKNIRNQFLENISSNSKNVLVITEGVIPYLTNSDAKSLADSLFQNQNFNYWITEYYSPEILSFLRTPKRLKQMENAPFLFYPDNWFDFFKLSGWLEGETKYFGEISEKLGRTPPATSGLQNETSKKYLGYTIYKKNLTASIKNSTL